jgi:hypothetical protein
MIEARDIPGVIAPPPLIALATFMLGLALDWFLPLFMLRETFSFWARLIIAAATGSEVSVHCLVPKSLWRDRG